MDTNDIAIEKFQLSSFLCPYLKTIHDAYVWEAQNPRGLCTSRSQRKTIADLTLACWIGKMLDSPRLSVRRKIQNQSIFLLQKQSSNNWNAATISLYLQTHSYATWSVFFDTIQDISLKRRSESAVGLFRFTCSDTQFQKPVCDHGCC